MIEEPETAEEHQKELAEEEDVDDSVPRHPIGVPMEEDSDSDQDEQRCQKNSMILNELAQFDDNNIPSPQQEEENLLADD